MLKKAVSYCRYPPNGIRGAAHSVVRASGYGIDNGYLSNCEDELLIICQVESEEGVKKIEEIAAVDGVDYVQMGPLDLSPIKFLRPEYCSEVELGESQWINCDIRNFKMDILGQYGVIMADPPWDIHMELPYGTMADDEMRGLNIQALQTDGLIFLWVTGRAMELGRECLELWGYKRVEEIIWVKTNQLQRIIRTGRTGHWLNHSNEHCLVGIKGDPIVNRNIDTDVIVAEVRETSRKPDEINADMWMSLGNQLSGARLVDDGLKQDSRLLTLKLTYSHILLPGPLSWKSKVHLQELNPNTSLC
ncbi:N6-adenosine-methyltransferase MT-A70-like protein [Tanacetum coccineum]